MSHVYLEYEFVKRVHVGMIIQTINQKDKIIILDQNLDITFSAFQVFFQFFHFFLFFFNIFVAE